MGLDFFLQALDHFCHFRAQPWTTPELLSPQNWTASNGYHRRRSLFPALRALTIIRKGQRPLQHPIKEGERKRGGKFCADSPFDGCLDAPNFVNWPCDKRPCKRCHRVPPSHPPPFKRDPLRPLSPPGRQSRSIGGGRRGQRRRLLPTPAARPRPTTRKRDSDRTNLREELGCTCTRV